MAQPPSKISLFASQVQSELSLKNIRYSEWIQQNFKDPHDHHLPFSFKDHDFQQEIVDCKAQKVVVKKPAQIGLSTVSMLYALTFCSLSKYRKLAYVLPTAKFSIEFSGTRLQPLIESSSAVSNLISQGSMDNVTTKRIGTSYLLMRGANTDSSAISVDLDQLVIDELDFCDPVIVGKFASRLQHSDLKITRHFSTPTVSGFGISKLLEESSQAYRSFFCRKCNTHQIITDFLQSLRLPGPLLGTKEGGTKFLDTEKLDRESVSGTLQLLSSPAYMACPKCEKPIDYNDLNEPSLRNWVHSYPDREIKGFCPQFWDVPKYNPVSEVLASLSEFATKGDWINFRLGREHDSTDNTLTMGPRSPHQYEDPENILSRNVFIGVDLGKKATHIMVGVPKYGDSNQVVLQVVSFWTVDITTLPNNDLAQYLAQLCKETQCVRMVIDSMPNYETSLKLHSMPTTRSIAYGAVYTPNSSIASLDIYTFNENTGVVKIGRTPSFDSLSRALTVGSIRFPAYTIDRKRDDLVEEHMATMKKIGQRWESTSTEDHYAHTLNYLYAAYSSVEERFVQQSVYMPPAISGVELRG